MRRTTGCLLAALVIASAIEARAADYYASTSGTPGGAGSLADPWDLQTALAQTSTIQPGDTLWLRGGTYEGSFTVLLAGTSASPITIRAFRRERVVLDHDSGGPCNPAAPVACSIDTSRCASLVVPDCAHDVVLRDLELTHSSTSGRTSLPAGGCTASPGCCYVDGMAPPLKPECAEAPASIARAQWQTVDVRGAGVRLVNCVVHDAGTGLAPHELAQDTEIYGALVFNNGWVNPLAGAGHGIHLENTDASFHRSLKRVRDSVVWNNFAYGVHAYTPVPRLVQNVHFDGAIAFNNGAPAAAFFTTDPTAYAALQGARYNNLYIDSEEPLARISVRSSHSYQPSGTAAVTGRFGSSFDHNGDLVVQNNTIVGPGRPLAVDRWSSVSLAANTLVGGATPAVGDTETVVSWIKKECKANAYSPDFVLWDYNQYCFTGSGSTPFLKDLFGNEYLSFAAWKADFPYDVHSTLTTSTPTANAIFVQPNLHEAGRAHVVVYNWQGLSSVNVSLAAVGLVEGQGYTIHNLQAFDPTAPAYFGTVVASGQYSAASPSVAVPMTDATVAAPIGFPHAIASTLPAFGVFLVRSTPCGDGNVDAGEACDDGNLVSGDGCDIACAVESCWACAGNPSVCTPDDGDTCDDGLFCTGSESCSGGACVHTGDPCPADPCLACNEAGDLCLSAAGAACGSDGNVCTNDVCDGAGACLHPANSASCDDGDPCTASDSCSAGACQPGTPVLVCGDTYICGPETCDDGNTNDGDGCDSNCTPTGCGNGIAVNEACDDGNLVDGDGCDSNCTPTACGNGVVTAGEACDDGNTVNGDGCDNNCTASACGNGITAGAEVCDDGNLVSGDGCDANCRPTGCPNGAVTGTEVCDDGNAVNGDGCDSNCTPSVCGNGIVAPGEGCDDGNLVSGDGCDANCTPTACGNGVRAGTEICDDGNGVDGDGCEADCRSTPISSTVAAGATVTTDVLSTGATAEFPVHVSVTTPNAGALSISSVVAPPPAPTTLIEVLGALWQIEAPAATAAAPLTLVFTVDASLIPPGIGPERIDVTRNGVLVGDCTGSPGVASPDPCVAGRVPSGGDVEVTVLTSAASDWQVVVRGLFVGEQKCVNLMNLAGVKVAKTQGTEASKCLRDAGLGTQPNAQACLTADALGKIALAFQKTTATDADRCAVAIPPFAFTAAAAVNPAAQAEALALVADLFGADLGSVAIAKTADPIGAGCQGAALKAVNQHFHFKAKAFLKCKKKGLAGKTGLMNSTLEMEACFDQTTRDSSNALSKAYQKVASTIAKKCAGVSRPAAFPGACAAAPNLAVCLDDRTDCRVCRLFNAMDGLAEDCDAFDDGVANGSCN